MLSLWEMHDRGPRKVDAQHAQRQKLQDMRRKKEGPLPTLDFDILPEELRCVLPLEMWATDKARPLPPQTSPQPQPQPQP